MTKARDASKFPNVITAAGDAKILDMTVSDITYDGVSLLGGGTATTSRRLQVDATDTAYFQEMQFRVTNANAAWTTLATITPSPLGGGTFTSGIVEARLVGLTNSVGVGSRFSRWAFDISAGVITFASMTEDVDGPAPPQFRLSGTTTILCQQQSSNGTNTWVGGITLGIFIPNPGGTTMSIT